jgi:ketosteroid isomerase-like protein
MSPRQLWFVLVILCGSIPAYAQGPDEKEILGILGRQTEAWNRGDLKGFMNGYWENDSLMYIGKGGVTYGFASTLLSYQRNYGDTARMGKLTFQVLHVMRLSDDHYYVVGKWSLRRSAGDVGGHYTLLWKKIRGQWVIVADHSS